MATPAPTSPDADKLKKAGLAMIALFGASTLLFFCGGGIVTGVAGSGSESDGVLASQIFVGPAFASLTGLLAAVITHFVVKEKLALKIAIPLAVSFFAFPCGLGCLIGFYEVIWPSL